MVRSRWIISRLPAWVFGFSGFQEYQHKNLFAVPTVSAEERKQMLDEVRKIIKDYA